MTTKRSDIKKEQEFRGQIVAVLPRLRRFAMSLTGSPDQADDLVQDAVERGLARAHQWRTGTRIDSWMLRIVFTIHVNRRRHDRKHKSLDPAEIEGLIAADGIGHMDSRLALNAVDRALFQLSSDKRLVLLLVGVFGLTYAEAANVLSIPVGTLRSRLARARFALHERLQDIEEDSVKIRSRKHRDG